MRTSRTFPAILAAASLALAGMPAGAQTTEGYDPLRQITQLQTPARLLIVLDTTGSMGGDVKGNGLTDGADSVGRFFWSQSGSGTSASGGKYSTWTYTLRYEAPSRMASVKNALGNTVSLVTSFTGPSNWQTYAGPTGVNKPINPNYAAVTCGSGCSASYVVTWPGSSAAGPWTWTVKFSQKKSGVTTPLPVTNQGVPIHAMCGDSYPDVPCTIADFPTPPPICATEPTSWACTPLTGFPLLPTHAATGAVRSFAPPSDVVGVNKSQVYWGLLAYSSSRQVVGCQEYQLLIPIDTNGGNPELALLEKYFWLTSGKISNSLGLQAGGWTPSKGALLHAKDVIQKTFAGGSVSVTTLDASNNPTRTSRTLYEDPRKRCRPPYGVILATDGLSNNCNPGNGNWISPCGSGASDCDTGSSGYDCPGGASQFAAQIAHDIWNLNLGGGANPVHPRTWTIGVSTQVGPCELDFVAYCGRTDASSPNGDAGYDYTKDRYNIGTEANPDWVYLLPQTDSPGALPNPSVSPSTNFGANYDGPTGQFKWFRNTSTAYSQAAKAAPYNQHGEYAFFATTAGSIADAFTAIVNATAAGDYTTNAPTSGGSVGVGTTVLLPSVEFPGWKGHLYAFDTTKLVTDPTYLLWDAGSLLKDPATRKIYTWDASQNLVQVTQANLAALQTIATASGVPAGQFTSGVISFMQGYDVAGPVPTNPRSWILGPLINSTVAITGPPPLFRQTNTESHAGFESTYTNRRKVAWVGSDDGMLHAFDFNSGKEILAIVPPDLLLLQTQLYQNYAARPGTRITGQPEKIAQHLYGVANSFRVADVYFQSDDQYHTIGILSQGPGGDSITAIDVTHPFPGDSTVTPAIPADPNYDPTRPVTILWRRDGSDLAGLYKSWSVPALAPTGIDTWLLTFGGGQNPASTATSQVAPVVFTADISRTPSNPSFVSRTLSTSSSPAPLVGNQAFADSSAFDTTAAGFRYDNLADLALQPDLNGRVWFQGGSGLSGSVYVGIDATAVAGSTQQPIYYSGAVSGYGPSTASCDVYGFGSGSFYERSPAVTGPNVGTSGYFVPNLYIAVWPKPASGSNPPPVGASNVYRLPITGTSYYTDDTHSAFVNLGPRTQLTSSPFLISPLTGKGPVQVLFLVYDPDKGCYGISYVISLTFTVPSNCNGQVTVTDKIAYNAGAGASSGFAIAGENVVVAKSDTERAGLFTTTVKLAPGGASRVRPVWWKEHK